MVVQPWDIPQTAPKRGSGERERGGGKSKRSLGLARGGKQLSAYTEEPAAYAGGPTCGAGPGTRAATPGAPAAPAARDISYREGEVRVCPSSQERSHLGEPRDARAAMSARL